MVPLTSEDYFNQFAFNQVTNIMMNNNNNNSQNTNNQYTYHTLQSPQIQNSHNYSNQLIPPNQNLNSYMSIGSTSSTFNNNNNNSNNNNNNNNKIVNRTPSYNSSLCGSSSSSPSSLLSSSNSSLNNLAQSSNTQNAVSSSTNESFDYDNAGTPTNGQAGANVVAANDPAELARQKQMRGLTLTPEELQLLAKDRQRKDNHNMSIILICLFNK